MTKDLNIYFRTREQISFTFDRKDYDCIFYKTCDDTNPFQWRDYDIYLVYRNTPSKEKVAKGVFYYNHNVGHLWFDYDDDLVGGLVKTLQLGNLLAKHYKEDYNTTIDLCNFMEQRISAL